MMSSIKVTQVFPELVGKKAHATCMWKVYGEMPKYIIDYALHLAQYDAHFHNNDDAKKCRYSTDTNNFIFSHTSFKLLWDTDKHKSNDFLLNPVCIISNSCFY